MADRARFDLHPDPRIVPEERERLMANLGFGRLFTEHMVSIRYTNETGWGRGRLERFKPLQLSPAASVLHYGQAIFEGFKAFRQPDGGIATFRPDANARRFQASARRLAMPELPEDLFLEAADLLIRQERDWVPSGSGESLYIRPVMIATEASLGVVPSAEYLFVVFGSPSGTYFGRRLKPVSVWVCEQYVRATPGGTGAVKCAGNYAAGLLAQQLAHQAQCDQVVWLDAQQRQNVEEMGGMNLFFVYQQGATATLVTPKLTGTLLPGITRDSILRLAPSLGYAVSERSVSVEEWKQAATDGRMTEAFACGTAAAITPIGRVRDQNSEWALGNGEAGPVAETLRAALLAVQHGTRSAPDGWMRRVC